MTKIYVQVSETREKELTLLGTDDQIVTFLLDGIPHSLSLDLKGRLAQKAKDYMFTFHSFTEEGTEELATALYAMMIEDKRTLATFSVQGTATGRLSNRNTKQPAAVPNEEVYVWELVKADMLERDEMGERKHKVRLQPHNGRDCLVDAYQEALDMIVYLRQAIYERDGK